MHFTVFVFSVKCTEIKEKEKLKLSPPKIFNFLLRVHPATCGIHPEGQNPISCSALKYVKLLYLKKPML